MDAARLHDLGAITREILSNYTLPLFGFHGITHWARVLDNGLRIAGATHADREVSVLFALFHDSKRVNEGHDPQHGIRGGNFAKELRGRLVHLDDRRFDLLYQACKLHSEGLTSGDPTPMACWDADRLDLGRVGITPLPNRLCTDPGRELIAWADEQAQNGHVPAEVLQALGLANVTNIA